MSVHRAGTKGQGQGADEHFRERAVQLIARWRRAGFDAIVRHPSTYCTPANLKVIRLQMPEGYSTMPIDSEESIEAVASSLKMSGQYQG